MVIYKSSDYEITGEKYNVPVKLMTNKYDEIYDFFIKKLKEKYEGKNEVIDLGILIRYNKKAGNLLGISICFYFGSIEEEDIMKLEIHSIEGFNISSEQLNQYRFFFENKLRETNLNLFYKIKHLDER